jgi:hypothetical protein
MFRSDLVGIAVLLSLLTAPSRAVSNESEFERGSEWSEKTGEGPGGGEVSVDLGESTPGLTQEVFKSSLASDGEWYRSERYGEVWRPRVSIGWKPYYYGSWLWTDEGWYWNSDEPFAWAVYHYGRWVFDPAWGWVWVPGYQWAPAWVTWRFGGDAVGWAPLGPGVSVFVTGYPFVDFWWTFVPASRFVGVPAYTVAYGPRETHRWFRGTSPAPPRTLAPPRDGRGAPVHSPAWGGPSRRVIEERTGRPVETVRRPAVLGPGGRVDRDRGTPGWTPTPDRRGPPERFDARPDGRFDARPAPRGEMGRPPEPRPEPRERERPEARPQPREPERRPEARPESREREIPQARPEVREREIPEPRSAPSRAPSRGGGEQRGRDRDR